jgi:hypothetical protein
MSDGIAARRGRKVWTTTDGRTLFETLLLNRARYAGILWCRAAGTYNPRTARVNDSYTCSRSGRCGADPV